MSIGSGLVFLVVAENSCFEPRDNSINCVIVPINGVNLAARQVRQTQLNWFHWAFIVTAKQEPFATSLSPWIAGPVRHDALRRSRLDGGEDRIGDTVDPPVAPATPLPLKRGRKGQPGAARFESSSECRLSSGGRPLRTAIPRSLYRRRAGRRVHPQARTEYVVNFGYKALGPALHRWTTSQQLAISGCLSSMAASDSLVRWRIDEFVAVDYLPFFAGARAVPDGREVL
jgi:hypothetical protein